MPVEQIHEDDGKLIVQKTWDVNKHLDRADSVRGNFKVGEMYHVGSVPFFLLDTWAKEAGVSLQDNAKMSEIIKKKLNDGTFARLRNWEGKW